MARIENHPKVILTQEEIETLRKARYIIITLENEDNGNYIFDSCDNCDSEWYWVDTFIENLMNISEVEKNV